MDVSSLLIPLLLAGLGIMAVGVAVGLVAVLLFLRRRSPATDPARVSWSGPPGPYPGAPYGSGTSPFPPPLVPEIRNNVGHFRRKSEHSGRTSELSVF